MIAISILLCLGEQAHWATLHVTQPTASAIEKQRKQRNKKEQDIEKSTLRRKKPRQISLKLGKQ